MAQVLPQKGGLQFAGFIGSGGLGTPPIVKLPVVSGNTLALFEGDALTKANDGTVYPTTAGDAVAISHVMVSAAQYLDADSVPRKGAYLPAAKTYTGTVSLDNPLANLVLCIPTDHCKWSVQIPTAASTKTAAQALVGQTVNIVATAGSTANGQSGYTTDTVANFKTPGDATHGQLLLLEIPQYDLQGRVNDPTQTYWTGIFRVNPALLGSYI
jgi:hypothetical protein